MQSFFEEFKKFIMRGNVVDLAVGIVIGAAFTAIVNSLVKDIFMPHRRAHHRRLRRIGQTSTLYSDAKTRLGQLRPVDHQLRDRRLLHVPGGQGDEQDEGQGLDGQGAAARADRRRRNSSPRSATS